jgi:transposase
VSESFVIFEVRNQNNTLTQTDMAKVVYKSYNQNDNLLFPHCIGDFIPENDPVRVLDAIVEHLDISAIEATYKGGGASSFAPRMLLKVILYAYLQNIHSGRKMEALLKRDVNFTQVVQMLVDAKFAAIAVAHNIRKMISKGYCVCSEVAVG